MSNRPVNVSQHSTPGASASDPSSGTRDGIGRTNPESARVDGGEAGSSGPGPSTRGRGAARTDATPSLDAHSATGGSRGPTEVRQGRARRPRAEATAAPPPSAAEAELAAATIASSEPAPPEVVSAVASAVGANSFRRWFADGKSLRVSGGTLLVLESSSFVIERMRTKCGAILEDVARRLLDAQSTVAGGGSVGVPAASDASGAPGAADSPRAARASGEPDALHSIDRGPRTGVRFQLVDRAILAALQPRGGTAAPSDGAATAADGGSANNSSTEWSSAALSANGTRPSDGRNSAALGGGPRLEFASAIDPTRGRQRLSEFVVGGSNRLAFEAATRMARGEAGLASLFIHGACGVGKTHVLRGLCALRQELFPRQQVLYTTAEAFTNEFIQHLRGNKLEEFRSRIRRLDLLAIDDVHFLADKKHTTGEFLHTFDAIGFDGKQVVLASDAPPQHIKAFSHALISRLVAGMVVQIGLPDRELRLALLRRLAGDHGLTLTEEAEEAVVGRIATSAREIAGALHKLVALRGLKPRGEQKSGSPSGGAEGREAIGMDLVEVLLRDVAERTVHVRPASIVAGVCTVLGIERSELLGRGRHQKVVLGRALVAWLAREMTTMSYPEIASCLGRDNHSTVHYAHQRLNDMMKEKRRVEFGVDGGTIPIAELVEHARRTIRRLG